MSTRRSVTPIALVLLASGALVYAWKFDRGVSDADRAARKADVFPSFRIEDVSRVELVHGGETTVLEREREAGASHWTMKSPKSETADAASVEGLLRQLESATRLRDVTGAAVDAGFDATRARGTIVLGATVYRFELGGDALVPEGSAYLRVEDEGTFVVDRTVKAQLLRGADAYRERTIVPFGEGAAARLQVEAANPGDATWALERAGATFRVAGVKLRASRDAADRVFSAIAGARADSFLDDARGTLAVTLEARDSSQPRVRFALGDACPGNSNDVVLLRTEPTPLAACVPRTVADGLRTSAGALVDRRAFFAHADEIEEVKLEHLQGAPLRVEIARRGSGWRERSPDDRDLGRDESDAAMALVAAMTSTEASDVRAPGPGDAADFAVVARARVTIVRTGGATNEAIELGPAESDGVLARRLDDGAILRLPTAAARGLDPGEALRALGRVQRDDASTSRSTRD